MSTFDGFVKEFPLITIDNFRLSGGRPRPSACFLSHVHSDHLLGLESLKMPFVYCSATTRRLLLRMEKYPHRINYAKGILETRKQHYRHLRSILRPLPLQTPCEIELGPKSSIQVTLFDANHCPGAVMFLIQGDGKAILYTGDVRAEPWWVNAIVQTPVLLRYTYGLTRLDCVYLDTTFATQEDKYKHFPGKVEGLRELMTKVAQCSEDSIFYFRAWTLGYEQVWIALADMLQSKVHVDDYQLRLFNAIVENGNDGYSMFEGPALAGFQMGNRVQSGCLTPEMQTRIHSCAPEMPCHGELKHKNVVWITPIISRMNDGTELLELGAGGGGGDLYQTPELDLTDEINLENLELLCKDLTIDSAAIKRIREAVRSAKDTGPLIISLEGLGLESDAEVSLKDLVKLVSQQQNWKGSRMTANASTAGRQNQQTIHFPFSRHSSYDELRNLISIFRPKDIHACTVDPSLWTEDVSMKQLFGDLCTSQIFHHDSLVRVEAATFRDQQKFANLKRKRQEDSQQVSQQSQPSQPSPSCYSARAGPPQEVAPPQDQAGRTSQRSVAEAGRSRRNLLRTPVEPEPEPADSHTRVSKIRREFHRSNQDQDLVVQDDLGGEPKSQESLHASAFESQESELPNGQASDPKNTHRFAGVDRASTRRAAYREARRNLRSGYSSGWDDISLRSLRAQDHGQVEIEL